VENSHGDYSTRKEVNQEVSLVISASNLPTTIDDLSKYVLVGEARLKAVRAAMQLITKVEVAQGVYEQKLKEAQEMAEAVLDAKVKLGELMAKVPKKQGFASTICDTDVANVETKQDVIRNAGFTPKQVQRFQTLATHPEAVEQAKAEAREKGDVVSQNQVLNKIKKPSGNPNGYSMEKRESRELTRRVLDFTHNAPIPEYTLDMLVNEIKLDADNYFSSLNFRLSSNAALISGENASMIGKLIDDYVICGIEEIRRKVS
jgi:hypothetical protein